MSTSAEVVSSIGNSWIIGRSKSYSGRIYYFNTLTGEAVWNLSETEVEKAKKRTSMLQSQNNFQIDNIPEPTDSPQNYSSAASRCLLNNQIQSQMPSKVYNKQIINNKFPKPPYPFVGQFPQYNPLNAFQLNIPVNPAFNTGLWNVNPQPIFFTPSPMNQVSPVINRTFHNHVPVKNTAMTLSSRFKHFHDDYSQSKIQQKKGFKFKFNTGGNKFGLRKRNFGNNFHNPGRKTDLRLLILSKKEKQSNEGIQDFNVRAFREKSSSITESPGEDKQHIIPSDENDDDLWAEQRIQRSMETLDTTPFKKLLKINYSEMWYIVIDSNVVLNNVNFLNMLLNSDNQCRLMVPEIVMENIQKSTNSRLRTQAHKAAYFISQQVDANVAVIDKRSAEENTNLKDEVINCCSNLTNQGYHVVLLTDDIELHNIENNTNLTIFTVRAMKRILNNELNYSSSNDQIISDSENKQTFNINSNDNRSIKITIPNEASYINTNKQEQESCESVSIQQYDDTNLSKEETINTIFEETDKSKPLLVEEFVDTNTINEKIDDFNAQATSTDLNVDEPRKPKRIYLKRSLSHDINTKNKSFEKKRHIWNKHKVKTNFSMNLRSKRGDATITNNCNEETVSNCDQSANTFSESNESSHKLISNKNKYNTFSNVTQKNFNENIIKETASKPIIPSTDKDNNCNEKCENVMFEITSTAMEECLKIKCDEWISRFVQIMEEAMTQILQQDPPFILDTMLPPWTIYEAAECVKRKYSYDIDVVDASTKLLQILFEIGGLRGKIKIDIAPNKYMEMYSYGVYLIDALQGSLNNSEDLQTAAESLSKLLFDIQDSHSNSNVHDSLIDATPENVLRENEDNTFDETDTVDESNNNPSNSQNQIIQPQSSTPTSKSSINTLKKYNLRSQTHKLLQEKEVSSKVTFIRNIDLESSFFTSLHLKKNLNNIKLIESQSESIDNNMTEEGNDVQNTNTCEINVSEEKTNEDEKTKSDEPKVIRNFITCPEFEKRLKNTYKEDTWSQKSEVDFDDNEQFDYDLMQDEYYPGNGYDYYDEEENYDENCSHYESQENVDGNNVNFKHVIGKLEHSIKGAFSSVREFCEQSYVALRVGGDIEKNEIQQLAEKTQLYVNSLCDALNSVLLRESSESAYKMREFFKIEEFQDIIVDDGDMEDYTNFITKCLGQGNILKESVKLVIDAIKEISR